MAVRIATLLQQRWLTIRELTVACRCSRGYVLDLVQDMGQQQVIFRRRRPIRQRGQKPYEYGMFEEVFQVTPE